MPVTNADITYTNGNSGRTRVNDKGLIVGVDFSTTSNTIGTGSRTFTLTATANVNRDWQVGSSVVAVAQAGATGSMIGTVTSYTPSTQELVLNITSITGSGTSTDWRIGSTMQRDLVGGFDYRDFDPVTLAPKGGLVEGGATNSISGGDSNTISGATQTGVISSNGLAFGIQTRMIVADPAGSAEHGLFIDAGMLPDQSAAYSFLIKPIAGQVLVRIGSRALQSASDSLDLNLQTLSITRNGFGTATIEPFANGFSLLKLQRPANTTGSARFSIYLGTDAGVFSYTGDNRGVEMTRFQIEAGSTVTSYIPKTTVSVTRAADQLSIGGTNFSQFYNSAQGTLVMELTPIAQAVGAVAGSLNDGTLNNAIRIAQKQSGTLSSIRKMATDGVTDVMAVNASTGNTLRSNGVDYTETPDQSGVVKLGAASSSVGQFLTVGGTENFRSSTDSGLTYNARTIGGTLGGSHFGIGRFVIAGSTSVINGATVGSVIVSTDGLAFRRVNIPGLTQTLNEITSNGTNLYVAVGAGGVIYTSPDAETWTAQTSGTTAAFGGVAFFSGRYVAANGTANQSKYSDNGTTWTSVTGLAAGMGDVAHNGTNLWVAVGAAGAIYSSADGITWTSRTSGVATTLLGIHFADGLWVAVGNAGTVVTSPDGITWTDRTATSGTASTLNEVGFFSGKFYGVLQASASVITATAGAAVTTGFTLVNKGLGSQTSNGIATNGSRLLISGSSGYISTSDDGTTFTSRTGNTAQLNGAAFGAGTYVIVGNAVNGSGLIATVNPTTFEYQRRVSNTTVGLGEVIFAEGAFYSAGATSRILRSTDGVAWTEIIVGGTSTTLNAAAFGNGIYVSAGTNGRYSTSTNGTTWTSISANQAMLPGAPIQDVTAIGFANGVFVATGVLGAIATSPNGTTWTLRTSGITTALRSVMYSTRDQQWYAAGDNGVILRSADAITWTSIANDVTVGIFTAGALQANPLAGKFIPNVKNRVAISWDATTGVNISINGGDVVSDPSVTMPVLTQYTIGMNGVSGSHWNSTIKTQKAYRVKVSNSELVALSRI